MKLYTYQAPLVKSATMKTVIFNSSEGAVGSIQRYYKTIFHSAFDFFAGSFCFFVSFKAFNVNDEIVIDATRKNHLIGRPDYYINFLQGELRGITLHARQKNDFDVFNQEFVIKGDHIEIHTNKGLLEAVQFYENGKVIARWQCKIKEKFKTYLEVEEDASIRDPLFYSLLGQMLYIVGS